MDERCARRPGRLKVTTWLIMGGEEIRSTVELDTKGLGALICCRAWEVASCGCIVLAVLWIWQVAAAGAATAAWAEENEATLLRNDQRSSGPFCHPLKISHLSIFDLMAVTHFWWSLGNCIFNPLFTASRKSTPCLDACPTPPIVMTRPWGRYQCLWYQCLWHLKGHILTNCPSDTLSHTVKFITEDEVYFTLVNIIWKLWGSEFCILRPHRQINIISCWFFWFLF